MVIREKVIEVKAPDYVEVTLRRQKEKGRVIVHLVNQYPGKISPTGAKLVEDISPAENIEVRLLYDKEPKNVYLAPEGVRLVYTREGRYLKIRIPRIHTHSMVVIEG